MDRSFCNPQSAFCNPKFPFRLNLASGTMFRFEESRLCADSRSGAKFTVEMRIPMLLIGTALRTLPESDQGSHPSMSSGF